MAAPDKKDHSPRTHDMELAGRKVSQADGAAIIAGEGLVEISLQIQSSIWASREHLHA